MAFIVRFVNQVIEWIVGHEEIPAVQVNQVEYFIRVNLFLSHLVLGFVSKVPFSLLYAFSGLISNKGKIFLGAPPLPPGADGTLSETSGEISC